MPYPRHEGTSGITQSGLRSVLGARLEANPADVVLLHIGTNDVNGSSSTDAGPTAAASNSILSVVEAFANSPDNPPVQLLLATIIGQKIPNPDTATFNSDLTARYASSWAAARPRYSVRLVDMNPRINPATDLSDLSVDVSGLHPSAAGYAKMANAWFDFLVQNDAVAKCP